MGSIWVTLGIVGITLLGVALGLVLGVYVLRRRSLPQGIAGIAPMSAAPATEGMLPAEPEALTPEPIQDLMEPDPVLGNGHKKKYGFSLGDRVKWTSQSHGVWATRMGRIMAEVPPQVHPMQIFMGLPHADRLRIRFDKGETTRETGGYLILCTARRQHGVWYPWPSLLRAVDTPADILQAGDDLAAGFKRGIGRKKHTESWSRATAAVAQPGAAAAIQVAVPAQPEPDHTDVALLTSSIDDGAGCGEDFVTIAKGARYLRVCSWLPPDEILIHANFNHPCADGRKWFVADHTYPSGQTNPVLCPKNPETHTHWLLYC